MPKFRNPDDMDELELLRFQKRKMLALKQRVEKQIRNLNWKIGYAKEKIEKRTIQYRQIYAPIRNKEEARGQ